MFLFGKPSRQQIRKILEREGFRFNEKDIDEILSGNRKGTRYGSAILSKENGKQTYFLKIQLDGKRKTSKLLKRQVLVSQLLTQHISTARVVSFSLKKTPYAVLETRETGKGFGFLSNEAEYYKGISQQDAEKLVQEIFEFHALGKHADKQLVCVCRKLPSIKKYYEKEFKRFLRKKIVHQDAGGRQQKAAVRTFLVKYLEEGFEEKIYNMLNQLFAGVEQFNETKKFLVHADMQIDNVYKSKNGNFELIDFEWVGITNNPAIAIMYDYGNLWERGWFSEEFRSHLDNAMYSVGKNFYQDPEIVNLGMKLGRLRYGLMMCHYRLDFVNTTKHDRHSTESYIKMFTKTVSDFKDFIENQS